MVGTTGPIAEILDLPLAPTPLAPARARAAISEWLGRGGNDATLVEIASLLVSELVTNGVQHGADSSDAPLRLSGQLSPTACRIELWNRGTSGNVAEATDRGNGADGGYGLQFVARLSDAWGVERDADGTTVWFELTT